MVLFLTSDDSVQPSEFEQMGRLSHIEKPFIVLLNVKGKLENETQIKRFLAKPEKPLTKKDYQDIITILRLMLNNI